MKQNTFVRVTFRSAMVELCDVEWLILFCIEKTLGKIPQNPNSKVTCWVHMRLLVMDETQSTFGQVFKWSNSLKNSKLPLERIKHKYQITSSQELL